MGIIVTKLKRQKGTYEVLEKLENEIQSIEEFKRSTEQYQKKIVWCFLVFAICLYSTAGLVFYLYAYPIPFKEQLWYIIPLLFLPIVLIFLKRLLLWYYSRQIGNKQKKLSKLQAEKKKILDEVMDKETYKVAKTILEKFAPEQIKKNAALAVVPTSPSFTPILSQRPSVLTYRNTANRFKTPGGRFSQVETVASTPLRSQTPPLALTRPILPRERSVLDKMVDYLVGDGPSNRYALICKNCSSHNGMALKEEFEYLSFKCCFCSTFNPARKQRPIAPKLDVPAIENVNVVDSESNPSDSTASSDTESHKDSIENKEEGAEEEEKGDGE